MTNLRIPGMTGIGAPALVHRDKLDAVIMMIEVFGLFDMAPDGPAATAMRDAIAAAQRGYKLFRRLL